jgi:hypothetical protein
VLPLVAWARDSNAVTVVVWLGAAVEVAVTVTVPVVAAVAPGRPHSTCRDGGGELRRARGPLPRDVGASRASPLTGMAWATEPPLEPGPASTPPSMP